MNSLLDKNTRANLRARDLAKALDLMERAKQHLSESIAWTDKGALFEDAYSRCEDAEACCAVALEHLRELLP